MKLIRVTIDHEDGRPVLINTDRIDSIMSIDVPSELAPQCTTKKTAIKHVDGGLLVVKESIDELVEALNVL